MDSNVCSICNGPLQTGIFTKFSLSMARCRQCGVVCTYPPITQEATLPRYSTQWFEQEYLPTYGIDPANPKLDHLAPRYRGELAIAAPFRHHNRLLDVGAGAGLFLTAARAAGWDVSGVEFAEFGPRYARQYFDLDVFHGTVDQACFPDAHFDVVVLQDTIEHVTEPSALFRELNRILRPGGAVMLSTPNFDSLSRRVLGAPWASISPAEHVCLFSLPALLALFEHTGFAPYRLETNAQVQPAFAHGDVPVHAMWIDRMLRRLDGPTLRLLLHKLSLGDQIIAIAVKQQNLLK